MKGGTFIRVLTLEAKATPALALFIGFRASNSPLACSFTSFARSGNSFAALRIPGSLS